MGNNLIGVNLSSDELSSVVQGLGYMIASKESSLAFADFMSDAMGDKKMAERLKEKICKRTDADKNLELLKNRLERILIENRE